MVIRFFTNGGGMFDKEFPTLHLAIESIRKYDGIYGMVYDFESNKDFITFIPYHNVVEIRETNLKEASSYS